MVPEVLAIVIIVIRSRTAVMAPITRNCSKFIECNYDSTPLINRSRIAIIAAIVNK